MEPTWEYANFHPGLDKEHMDRWRIWEEGGEIVAFAHYEWRMGEGFQKKSRILSGIILLSESSST